MHSKVQNPVKPSKKIRQNETPEEIEKPNFKTKKSKVKIKE